MSLEAQTHEEVVVAALAIAIATAVAIQERIRTDHDRATVLTSEAAVEAVAVGALEEGE